MTIESAPVEKVYPVPERLLAGGDIPKPFVASFDEYKAKWEESVKEPKKFFGNVCICIYRSPVQLLSLTR